MPGLMLRRLLRAESRTKCRDDMESSVGVRTLADAQEDLAGLDDGVDLGALLELEILERGYGDRRRDDVAAADVDLHDGRHLALVDRQHLALEDVAGTELHRGPLVCLASWGQTWSDPQG